ncbi:MAG TPA: adenylate/guanylate cyclase domain-containing protein [Rectinemataceae bacterium]|nr:adenylate/guanylate cyclase domain-containing protein [Rectinemataceae bacterium]
MDNNELKLSAILSMDIPGLSFSGDSEEEADSIERCHRLVHTSALSHGGSLIKAIGDSFIITFANCQDAVKCALDLAENLGASPSAAGSAPRGEVSSRLLARMGIHLGDVRFFEKNVFGDAVDIASALQVAARPGSICVSGEVLSLVREKIDLNAALLSGQRHKAIPGSIHAYEISPPTAAASTSSGTGPSLGDIRKAILEEIRLRGRRLTVEEALGKFGWYGIEATEVIASLADAGILIGKKEASSAKRRQAESAAGTERKPQEQDEPWEETPKSEAPGYASAASAGDLGKSIESAIHSIVTEIERAVESNVRSNSASYVGKSSGSGFHIRIDKDSFKESAQNLKEVGREIKRQVRESRYQERHGGHSSEYYTERQEERARRRGGRRSDRAASSDNDAASSTTSFDTYRSELTLKAGKLRKGLIGDFIGTIVANVGLWYVNLNFSQGVLWAPIVSIFTGFGLVDSILQAARASRHASETEALPELDEERTKELKKMHKERNSIGKHFISALSIPMALYYINTTFDKGNSWFLIPAAIMVATFFIHFMTYITTAPSRRRKFFEKLGIKGNKRGLREAKAQRETTTTELGAYAGIYRDAQDYAKDIEGSLASSDPSSAAELKPQMDGYLKQVFLLAKTANELDSIIGEIPMEALEKDKAALKAKLGKAAEGMRSEYEGSIKEIEKQEESFKALAEQSEVIDLRLRSSVSQLQQLKMDLARARAADAETDTGRSESALSSIRARSEELSHYIDDLKQGNLEALADPFLELEKKYGQPSDTLKTGTIAESKTSDR